MSGTKDFDRLLLPRWLNSNSAAVSLGNRQHHPTLPQNSERQFHYLCLEREWQRSLEIYHAVDFVSSAVMYGDWFNPAAVQAAKYIVQSERAGSSQISMAESFLRADCIELPDILVNDEEEADKAVRRIRAHLSKNSMDALAWLDISYYYAILSQTDASLKAMLVASELASKTPFIVRSAARAFLHFGDEAKSLELLRRSCQETGDLSFAVSEVVIAQQCKVGSRFEDKIFKNFKSPSGRLRRSPVWSEIGVTIATKESLWGAHKKAKKSLSSVVRHISSENVLAQVEWLSARENFPVQNKPEFYGDYEADAISAYNQGKMDVAVKHCVNWARFQPFSSAPGMHGSYVASVALADFELAERLSSYAHRFSKDEFLSINNYAFSLAANDKVDKAFHVISETNPEVLDVKDRLTYMATLGFLQYKTGDFEGGRESYIKALAGFKEGKFKKSYAIAAHFWMMVDKAARSKELMDEILEIAKNENIVELSYYYRDQ